MKQEGDIFDTATVISDREASYGVDLKSRTKKFTLGIINLCKVFGKGPTWSMFHNQLVRAGGSVGANTRAAFRGRSKKEFIAKLGIVVEEVDECAFWLEILLESGLLESHQVDPLLKEADELTAIFVSVIKKNR